MAFRRFKKVKAFLVFLFGMLCLFQGCSAEHSMSSTSTVSPAGVKRCYKCESNCENGLGQIEDCHPDSDFFSFACYTNFVDGKPFQRGCTLDFTQGAEKDCVVTERGNMFCFCKTDACNSNSKAGRLAQTITSFLQVFSSVIVIGGHLINYL